jgi:hypothetical protein
MRSKLTLNGPFSAVVGLAIAGQILVGDRPAEAMTDALRPADSEAQVDQAAGDVRRDLQGALLSLLTPESGGRPSCDPSNAASPACYTATQQRTPPEGDIVFGAATFARTTTTLRQTRSASSEVERNRLRAAETVAAILISAQIHQVRGGHCPRLGGAPKPRRAECRYNLPDIMQADSERKTLN